MTNVQEEGGLVTMQLKEMTVRVDAHQLPCWPCRVLKDQRWHDQRSHCRTLTYLSWSACDRWAASTCALWTGRRGRGARRAPPAPTSSSAR